jgi:hypothetical protein
MLQNTHTMQDGYAGLDIYCFLIGEALEMLKKFGGENEVALLIDFFGSGHHAYLFDLGLFDRLLIIFFPFELLV